jgi:hypothetical protein
MANQFRFSMSEDFLRGYAEYLQQLREQNPGKSYKVTLSVDLIPDGLGYEMSVPPQITIDEEEDQEITIGTPEEAHAVAMSLSDADIERIEEEEEAQ